MVYRNQSAYQLVEDVVGGGCSQPTQAWKSAVRLSGLDCSGVMQNLRIGLSSHDSNVMECCLEVLASRGDPQVTAELKSVFQDYPLRLTGNVASVARLRTSSKYDANYAHLDQKLREVASAGILGNPLELIDMIPKIKIPHESRLHAAEVIWQMYANPNFFRSLSENDIRRMHGIFYRDYENEDHLQYRQRRIWGIKEKGGNSVKMWSFDRLRTQPEQGNQWIMGPSSIPLVMPSLVDKLREAKPDNPVQFAGESFYHFNSIHPFQDYNGRTNWVLLNLFLLHSGLPFVRIKEMDVNRYFQSLNAQDPSEFVKLLVDLFKKQVN